MEYLLPILILPFCSSALLLRKVTLTRLFLSPVLTTSGVNIKDTELILNLLFMKLFLILMIKMIKNLEFANNYLLNIEKI